MDPIRVGIVGVGNCASALVQGVEWYRRNPNAPGLLSPAIGGYVPSDVVFSAAFDVNETKVGLDLSQAVYAPPNNTLHICDVPYLDITVVAGPKMDGLGRTTEGVIKTVAAEGDVVEHLRATRTDVVVNYLPVGSEKGTRYYADCALRAGCHFVNAIPVRIARDELWRKAFAEAGLVLIGDDIKSQVGATIVHRQLVQLFAERGAELLRTYQLNVGGNLDFLNMLDTDRLDSKRESKTSAVVTVANDGRGLDPDNVHIGPSDFVPWLQDRKVAMIRLEGAAFAGAPVAVELRMEVWDSPNSAGVVIDAVRHAMVAAKEGRHGALLSEAAWLMKAPPVPMTDDDALERVQEDERERSAGREH